MYTTLYSSKCVSTWHIHVTTAIISPGRIVSVKIQIDNIPIDWWKWACSLIYLKRWSTATTQLDFFFTHFRTDKNPSAASPSHLKHTPFGRDRTGSSTLSCQLNIRTRTVVIFYTAYSFIAQPVISVVCDKFLFIVNIIINHARLSRFFRNCFSDISYWNWHPFAGRAEPPTQEHLV